MLIVLDDAARRASAHAPVPSGKTTKCDENQFRRRTDLS
jgi:hypothetical protein